MIRLIKAGIVSYDSLHYDKSSAPSGTITDPSVLFVRADQAGDDSRVLAGGNGFVKIYEYDDNTSSYIETFAKYSESTGFPTDADLSGNTFIVGVSAHGSSLGRIEMWHYDPSLSSSVYSLSGWIQMFEDEGSYRGTVAGAGFGREVGISNSKVHVAFNDGTLQSVEYSLQPNELTTKRFTSSPTLKTTETDRKVKVLGTDDTASQIAYLDEGFIFQQIFDSEKFLYDSATGNPEVSRRYSTDVQTRSPAVALDQVVQMDNATFAFFEETSARPTVNSYVYGSPITMFLSGEWSETSSYVAIYNQVSAYNDAYFFETSAPRALLDGLEYGYGAEIPADSVTPNFNSGKLYMDSFTLKNFLGPKYDVEITTDVGVSPYGVLSGIVLMNTRDYSRIGTDEDNAWISYSVGQNYENSSAFTATQSSQTVVPIEKTTTSSGGAYDYEYIERLRGVNRFGLVNSHKSNVFSIEINNSNLNESITDASLRVIIQRIVERSIRSYLKKVIPAHVQVWKVIWKGK